MEKQQFDRRAVLRVMAAGIPSAAVVAGLIGHPRAADARQTNRVTLAISLPELQSPFFAHVWSVAQAEADRRAVDLLPLDSGGDAATQAADLESIVRQGVAGVAVWPVDPSALSAAIQTAADLGVSLVTVDRFPLNSTTLAHVGADNRRGGEQQAELLMRLLPEGGGIIELSGPIDSAAALDRDAGLRQGLAGDADFTFAYNQAAGFSREQGRDAAAQALKSVPEAVGIVAADDQMALGAWDAASAAGRSIPIVGFDATPEALAAVRDGQLTATVEAWPGRQMAGAIQILADFARNGVSPALSTILIEPTVITAENLGAAERATEAGIAPAASPVAS